MAEEKHVHDVLIVGASVAGATAAALLAADDWDVLLLDAKKFPLNAHRIAWIGPQGKAILKQAKVPTRRILSNAIVSCNFYSSDFSKHISPSLPKEKIFLIDEPEFVQAILSALVARKSGRFRDQAEVVRVTPSEDHTSAILADRTKVYGKLLLIATGYGSQLLEQVGLSASAPSDKGLWTASYVYPRGKLAKSGHTDFILGVGGPGGYAYRMAKDALLTVGICAQASASATVTALMQMSQHLVKRELLPADWQTYAAGTQAIWSPAGLALEMESHVAKRTLTIGRVGGFVASHTDESIDPCMWSAQLSMQVVRDALMSRQPQDKLREFESLWSIAMAEYLRPPNTDPQSLLSLIFSNQQIADKMLEAILLGANF